MGMGKRTGWRLTQQANKKKSPRLLRRMYKMHRLRKAKGQRVKSMSPGTLPCILYNGHSKGNSIGTGTSPSRRVCLIWWWNSCHTPFSASMRSLVSNRSNHRVLCSFSTCHGSPSVVGKVLSPLVRMSKYRLWTRRWRIEM